MIKSIEANTVNYNERMLSIISLYLKEDVQKDNGIDEKGH